MNLASWLFLLMMTLFLGIIFWSFRPQSKKRADEISQSILHEKD